jgi:hypothetical protein
VNVCCRVLPQAAATLRTTSLVGYIYEHQNCGMTVSQVPTIPLLYTFTQLDATCIYTYLPKMFTTAILLSVLGLAAAAPAQIGTTHLQVARAGSFDGTATYYYQGGNPGSCGDYHSGESSVHKPFCPSPFCSSTTRYYSISVLPSPHFVNPAQN